MSSLTRTCSAQTVMSVYRETANVALFNKLACTQVNIADRKIFYIDGTINLSLTDAEEWSVNAPRAVPTTLQRSGQ